MGGGFRVFHATRLVGGGLRVVRATSLVGGGFHVVHATSLVGGGFRVVHATPCSLLGISCFFEYNHWLKVHTFHFLYPCTHTLVWSLACLSHEASGRRVPCGPCHEASGRRVPCGPCHTLFIAWQILFF